MVVVFIAEGFEEIEAIAPIDILRRINKDVKIVGIGSKTIVGSHGIPIVCDCKDDEINPDASLEAVVLPGGMPGTKNLDKSQTVHSFLDYAFENSFLIAAICAAPSILGRKGFLKKKKATVFPAFEKDLEGALLSDDCTQRDGNIITSKGAGAAIDFACEIAAYFVGEEKTTILRETLQCPK